MAKTDQYTTKQMIDALQRAKGMPTVAARLLNCSYTTVKRYIDNHPTVAQARQEAMLNLGDEAELTLFEQALGKYDQKQKKRVTEPNLTALIFLLKTRFKDRGYTERIEIMGGLDLKLVNETAQALSEAGIDATEFFQRAILRAKQKQDADNG